ncbi:MAG: FHA domain-containing protein [Chloroflexota bacterium]
MSEYNTTSLRCPHCKETNLPGSLICRHCYRILIDLSAGIGTRDLGNTTIDTRSTTEEVPAVKLPRLQQGDVLLSIGNEEVIKLDMRRRNSVLIGRFDSVRNIRPEVDLGPYGAAEHGVSRCHAALKWVKRTVYLQDLNSANGTVVNGEKLRPHMPHVIRGGEKIQLGRLQIRIRVGV